MRLSLLVVGLVVVLLGAALATGWAAATQQSVGDVDRETQDVARLLKCPVCQSQSVADSSSPLAGQMRDLIRRKAAAGESREAILSYFVDIYGEDVLLDPPKTGFSGLVWAVGLAVPIAGLGLAWLTWRSRRAPSERESDFADDGGLVPLDPLDTEPLEDEETSLVEAELERLVGGDAR